VLRNVDYLVAGSGWPAKWTGESDPFIALSCLQREYNLRIAATTLGDRGALALCSGHWAYSPAFEILCADTTGAGDVFHGAFCYAVLNDLPLERALEFSNAAAALNCTAVGARGHIPTLFEVNSLIANATAGSIARRYAREIMEQFASKASEASMSS
jgi:sulfofructose kinase